MESDVLSQVLEPHLHLQTLEMHRVRLARSSDQNPVRCGTYWGMGSQCHSTESKSVRCVESGRARGR